jgi:hypothetical protein
MIWSKLKSILVQLLFIVMSFFLLSCNFDFGITTPSLGDGSIHGIVVDKSTMRPLVGVAITCKSKTVYSNSQGKYALDNLPCSSASLVAKKNGYEDYVSSVAIRRNETSNLTIFMIPIE